MAGAIRSGCGVGRTKPFPLERKELSCGGGWVGWRVLAERLGLAGAAQTFSDEQSQFLVSHLPSWCPRRFRNLRSKLRGIFGRGHFELYWGGWAATAAFARFLLKVLHQVASCCVLCFVFTWQSTWIRRSLVSGRRPRRFGQTLRHYNPTHRRPIETRADLARHASYSKDGAGDGTRTRDVQLGKLAFFQLNYSRSTPSVSITETATCVQPRNCQPENPRFYRRKYRYSFLKTKRKESVQPCWRKRHQHTSRFHCVIGRFRLSASGVVCEMNGAQGAHIPVLGLKVHAPVAHSAN
jgi:hypothetical protein